MSEHQNELHAALAKAQGSMTNAHMDKTNPHFKSRYASLASILDTVREPLAANGLAISSQIVREGQHTVYLLTTLLHASGERLVSEYPLPEGVKPQEFGSALTYARRYTISALCGISADEDDDGNAAQTAKKNGHISAEQVETLQAKIDATKTDRAALLTYFGVKALDQLTPDQHTAAIERLGRRAAANG